MDFCGNLFRMDTCDSIGQCVHVVVNFVLSKRFRLLSVVFRHRCADWKKLMSIQSALMGIAGTVFSHSFLL